MKRYEVSILESWRPTPTTQAVRTERPPTFHHAAGQHAVVELTTREGQEDRFLSVASSPVDPHLEFAVRVSDSSFKQRFTKLAPGDTMVVAGPLGRFTRDPARPALFLSGGIGITPLISMVREAYAGHDEPKITLLYANRTVAEIAYREELDAVAAEHEGLRVVYFVDEPPKPDGDGVVVGRIDGDTVRREAARLGRPIYYMCGPPGMVHAMHQHLLALSVRPIDVRREDFIGY